MRPRVASRESCAGADWGARSGVAGEARGSSGGELGTREERGGRREVGLGGNGRGSGWRRLLSHWWAGMLKCPGRTGTSRLAPPLAPLDGCPCHAMYKTASLPDCLLAPESSTAYSALEHLCLSLSLSFPPPPFPIQPASRLVLSRAGFDCRLDSTASLLFAEAFYQTVMAVNLFSSPRLRTTDKRKTLRVLSALAG